MFPAVRDGPPVSCCLGNSTAIPLAFTVPPGYVNAKIDGMPILTRCTEMPMRVSVDHADGANVAVAGHDHTGTAPEVKPN
jgi:hypothetical protein